MKPFALAVSEYVGSYLPHTMRCSPNTIRSYCDGLVQFMEFAEAELQRDARTIRPADLTYEFANAYIKHMLGRGLSESSCNQRMACLKSFLKWLSRTDLSYFAAWEAFCNAKPPRAPEPTVDWLTLEEMKLLLSLPDPRKPSGLRDLTILAILYEAAARCQELCDLNVGSVSVPTRTITLVGKGRRTRSVPLGKESVAIVKKHIEKMGSPSKDAPLVVGRNGGRITPSGVQYVVSKYVQLGQKKVPGSLRGKTITPHVFRHSKAMHLLDAGVELIYIRDFLGHKSVRTTEVYARANPETKRMAIEKHASRIGLKERSLSLEEERRIIDEVKSLGRAARSSVHYARQ